MVASRADLKRYLTSYYLAGTQAMTNRLLRGRLGERDFQRIVIVAAIGRNNGIARGAQLQYNALRTLGVDADLVDATPALRNPLVRMAHRPGTAYVFHAGAPQTASLIGSVLPHAANAYRIGYWAWELPDPPADWLRCDRAVAEIWTPSEFSRASLAKLTAQPIHVVPHCIPAGSARRRRTGGPFTVLAMADSRSSLSRKNPEGALRAFRAAFGSSPAARFVLKLSASDEDLQALKVSLGDLLNSGNVEVINRRLDDAELAALFQSADVLVSLHRAEGFGLPLAEAMAHGVPVVGTGWSGNLTFMSAADSHLVPYTLIPVNDTAAIYQGSVWAEPDINDAADALRRLANDPLYYARLAEAAHRRAHKAAPSFPFAMPGQAASTLSVSYA